MNKNNCVVLMIDLQEKLVNATNAADEVRNAYKILKTASLMDIPIVVTEQYPKGLGETVSELKNVFNENTFLFEKTDFSALNNDDVLKKLEVLGKKQNFTTRYFNSILLHQIYTCLKFIIFTAL